MSVQKKYYRRIPTSYEHVTVMTAVEIETGWPRWVAIGMLEWLWLMTELGQPRIDMREIVQLVEPVPCDVEKLVGVLTDHEVLVDHDEETGSWAIKDWR